MKKLTPIALVLLLVVLGCGLPGKMKDLMSGGKTGEGRGGGSSSSSGGGTATGGSDPKADVVAASKKFLELPYFTANMEGMGEIPIKSQVAYAAPDRFHVKYLGGTGSGMEMIWIGQDMYMNANGKWSKMPTAQTSIPNLRDSFTEEGLKTLSDVKFVDNNHVLRVIERIVAPYRRGSGARHRDRRRTLCIGCGPRESEQAFHRRRCECETSRETLDEGDAEDI